MDQRVSSCVGPSGSEVAYATSGSGPPLLLAAWWTSHLELDWQNPEFRAFVERLGARHTVVRYDRPGVGMSERVERAFDLETETACLAAVADAADCDRFDLLGISCGTPPSIRLAARWPERVRRLLVFGGYLDGSELIDGATRSAVVSMVSANWGFGSKALTSIFLPDADAGSVRRFSSAQRHTTTAPVAAALLDLTFHMDASDDVAGVLQPALVLHRAQDQAVGLLHGERLAAALPAGELRVLEGRAHLPWAGDVDGLLGEVEAFLDGGSVAAAPQRRLGTICFVDVVGSTAQQGEIGDARWRDRLDELARLLVREAGDRGGIVLKDTGDGAMLVFDLPSEAVVFADRVRREVRGLGLECRAGLHTGEYETRGDDVTGRAVSTAARVTDQAQGGTVLVTAVTAELAAGRGLRFDHLGVRRVKGIETPLSLYEAEPRPSRPVADDDAPSFVRDGDGWRLRFQGRENSIRHAKGIADLAALVSNRGHDVDAAQLFSGSPNADRSTGSNVLDDDAIRGYRDRLGEVEALLDAADEAGDAEGSAVLDEERGSLLAELRASLGLGGRSRRMGDDVERARKAVAGRIRDAIRKVRALDPALADHLAEHVTTGRVCRYR